MSTHYIAVMSRDEDLNRLKAYLYSGSTLFQVVDEELVEVEEA